MNKEAIRRAAGDAMAVAPLRIAANAVANHLPWAAKQRIHGAFGYALRHRRTWRDTAWAVSFGPYRLSAPLRAESPGMDWVCAMTLLGHDVDEKRTYLNLLQNAHVRPELFLDVGGNYGVHALQMLAAGVPTYYFEPNAACHGYFAAACALNGFAPAVHTVALGETDGELTLAYPAGETWNGSVNPDTTAALAASHPGEMIETRVPVQPLDSFLADLPAGRVLMKLDAEGSELAILRGGRKLLADRRPLILFEAHRHTGDRQALWEFLRAAGYGVTAHPWSSRQATYDETGFLSEPRHNFVAVPL